MPLPYVNAAPRLRSLASDRPHLENPASDPLAAGRPTEGGAVSESLISYPLQFGIYRDGDNNLDEAQAPVIDQAENISAADHQVAFNIEDTTHRDDGILAKDILRTEQYDFVAGEQQNIHVLHPQDMADRATLGAFVAHTLDEAQSHHAQSTWLDLVDHGGGDAGAFETDLSGGNVMSEDDIAGAIADGMRMHEKAHPEDGIRKIDGVIMNACLMATCGLESALSHVGVAYLAASPETMIAPGAPSSVAEDIVRNLDDPSAMAHGIVHRTMHTEYGIGDVGFTPAAAFDVFDLNPQKIAALENSVKDLNSALIVAAHNPAMKAAIKNDGRSTEGMTRSQDRTLPWHADRPAESLYGKIASDTRLSAEVRAAAATAKGAIAATILAHGESKDFEPFGDESYRDAVGPTVHFPVTKHQIDPWAPAMPETDTAFASTVGEKDLARALT